MSSDGGSALRPLCSRHQLGALRLPVFAASAESGAGLTTGAYRSPLVTDLTGTSRSSRQFVDDRADLIKAGAAERSDFGGKRPLLVDSGVAVRRFPFSAQVRKLA